MGIPKPKMIEKALKIISHPVKHNKNMYLTLLYCIHISECLYKIFVCELFVRIFGTKRDEDEIKTRESFVSNNIPFI